MGDVLFSTKESSPYDLAVVQLRDSLSEASVPQMAQSFHPGLVTFLLNGDIRTTVIKSATCFMFSTKREPFLHLEKQFSDQLTARVFFCLQVILWWWWGMGAWVGAAVRP